MGSNPVFPIIINNISYLINLINLNRLQKNFYFNIEFSKKTLNFLIFLKLTNFIHKYTFFKHKNKFFIKIYIYFYKQKQIISFFKLILKSSKTYYVTKKAITMITKKSGNSIFVLSTNKGLMSNHSAIKKNSGGVILGFFSL